MSSQKLICYRVFSALLLSLNVLLLLKVFIVLKQRSAMVSEVTYLTDMYNSTQIGLNAQLNNAAIFDGKTICRLLDELNVRIAEEDNRLYLFVPPYPCGACLDNELRFIEDATWLGMKVSIIIPKYRCGDMNIQTRSNANVSLHSYTWTESADLDSLPKSQILYFRKKADIIYDILLLNQSYPEMSHQFFIAHS